MAADGKGWPVGCTASEPGISKFRWDRPHTRDGRVVLKLSSWAASALPLPHRRRTHTPLCAPHVHSPTSFQVRVCLQAWVGKLTTRRSNRKPPDSLSSKCGGTEAHRRLFLSAFVCDLHKFACVSQSHHTQFGKQLKVNPLHLCQPMAGTDTITIQAATASFPLKNLLIYYGIIFSIPENALCDNNNNV